MKKKLLAVLLCFCMLAALLPTVALAAEQRSVDVGAVTLTATVGGDVVYALNDASGAVTTQNANAGNYTIKFEAPAYGDPQLTLKNATITGGTFVNTSQINSGIYCAGLLSLVLEGSNTITAPAGTANGQNAHSAGIFIFSTLTIAGSGSLTAIGGTVSDLGRNSYGLYVSRLVVKKNASVTGTATYGAGSYGVYARNTVQVSGALTGNGGNSQTTSSGIYTGGGLSLFGGVASAYSGKVAVANGREYGMDGGVSILSGTLTASSAPSQTAHAAMSQAPSYNSLTSYTLTAGNSESSAQTIVSPVPTDYTGNHYVKIVASTNVVMLFDVGLSPVTIENGSASGTFKVTYDDAVTDNLPASSAITITGTGSSPYSNSRKVTINASNATVANPLKLILSDLKVTNWGHAFQILGSSYVEATLSRENTLYTTTWGSTLLLEKDAALLITANSPGTLHITGTVGAGIGGAALDALGGTLVINGGTLTTVGVSGGAGISCSKVVINGGTVSAIGSCYNGNTTFTASGIGYGTYINIVSGDPSDIQITGGTLTAISGSSLAPAIGGSSRGGSATFSISPTSGMRIAASAGTNAGDATPLANSPFTTGQTGLTLATAQTYFHSEASTIPAPPVAIAPTFSLADGTYAAVQSVTLSCATDDATIYYTTNGDEPTTSSPKYTSAISVDQTTTIKAKAFKDGMTESPTASATYTINIPHTVTVTPPYERIPDASTGAPETGDSSNMVLLITLLLISGGVLTVFWVNKNRKNSSAK